MNENTEIPRLGIGTWLSLGSSVAAEIASECGYDWLLFDLEHGVLTEDSLLANLQAAKNGKTKLIVRVDSADPVLIARVLEWGAAGIMLPHVSSPDQAEACLQYMRYPPRGKRGYTSGARTFRYGLSSAEEIAALPAPLFIAQIEDYEGVINAERIAGVEGVDILFVGPADLRLELSTRTEPLDYNDALTYVLKAAMKKNAQTGILAKDAVEGEKLKTSGFQNIAVGSDLRFLREGLLNTVKKMREAHKAHRQGGNPNK